MLIQGKFTAFCTVKIRFIGWFTARNWLFGKGEMWQILLRCGSYSWYIEYRWSKFDSLHFALWRILSTNDWVSAVRLCAYRCSSGNSWFLVRWVIVFFLFSFLFDCRYSRKSLFISIVNYIFSVGFLPFLCFFLFLFLDLLETYWVFSS